MSKDQGFKVGDRVYQIRKGVWGTVKNIYARDTYAVHVQFDNDTSDAFTFSGLEYVDDKQPMLVLEEVKIEVPARKFAPTLIGKTLVITHTMRGQAKRILIGKVESETETTVKIENRVEITKSSIKSIHDLGEEIKL